MGKNMGMDFDGDAAGGWWVAGKVSHFLVWGRVMVEGGGKKMIFFFLLIILCEKIVKLSFCPLDLVQIYFVSELMVKWISHIHLSFRSNKMKDLRSWIAQTKYLSKVCEKKKKIRL